MDGSPCSDKENFNGAAQPPPERKKLLLAKPEKDHFSVTISKEELEKMNLDFVSQNTAKTLTGQPQCSCLGSNHGIVVPESLLKMIFWIVKLNLLEAKQDYPAKTLFSGRLCYMWKKVYQKHLHGTMNTHFRALRQQEVGAKINHAEIITSEKDLLRERGVTGTSTPLALL